MRGNKKKRRKNKIQVYGILCAVNTLSATNYLCQENALRFHQTISLQMTALQIWTTQKIVKAGCSHYPNEYKLKSVENLTLMWNKRLKQMITWLWFSAYIIILSEYCPLPTNVLTIYMIESSSINFETGRQKMIREIIHKATTNLIWCWNNIW